MRFLMLSSLMLLVSACPKPTPPVINADIGAKEVGIDDAMPPPPDVAQEGVDAKCARACNRLADPDLQCPEALGFPGGKSCGEVCTQTQGSPFAMKVDCVIGAKTVKEVQEACHIRCEKK